MYMVPLLSQKQLLCNQRKENDPKFEIDHFGLKVINYDNTSED